MRKEARIDKKILVIFGIFIFLIGGIVLICLGGGVSAECIGGVTVENNISQYGITWFFDKPYQCGTFVNGDFWVKTDDSTGVVNVIRMTPDMEYDILVTTDACTYTTATTDCAAHNNEKYHFDLTNDYMSSCVLYQGHNGYCTYKKVKHGFMVNPSNPSQQGFDARVSSSSFNESVIPNIPYIANGNDSIIKVISFIPWQRPRLKSAAVLTVLDKIPTDNGSTIFRPPYFGNDKKLYSFNDVGFNNLPSYEPVIVPPPLSYFYNPGIEHKFTGVQIDYFNGAEIDYIHPHDNMPNDGGALAFRNANIALRLMLNDTFDDKRELAINYIQHGIDLYYAGIGGTKWPITFAAVMLNDSSMKEFVRTADDMQFQENGVFHYTKESNNVLWSLNKSTYWNYWRYWSELVNLPDSGGKVGPDPHNYIDGSSIPGITYLDGGNAMQAKYTALAIYLMLPLRDVWNDEELLIFADRWTYHGVITQPDPCAPPTGICKAGTNRAGQTCTLANSYRCNLDSPPSTYDYSVLSLCDYPSLYALDYGVKYGLNSTTNECIHDTDTSDGIGRLPWVDGMRTNSGVSSNSWKESLWDTYRNCTNEIKDGTETGVDCGGICPDACASIGNCEIKKAYWRIV